MGKRSQEKVSGQPQTLPTESGSPFAVLGCGPRIKRLTTWEPERWKHERDASEAGLPPLSRGTMRFHTWADRGNLSLTRAYVAGRNMARGNLTWGHFLVLAGTTGVGKTHLALAIAWEWFDDGFTVVFSRVDDLLDHLRQGYENDTYHRRLEKLQRCSLLVLDDLNSEHTTS